MILSYSSHAFVSLYAGGSGADPQELERAAEGSAGGALHEAGGEPVCRCRPSASGNRRPSCSVAAHRFRAGLVTLMP